MTRPIFQFTFNRTVAEIFYDKVVYTAWQDSETDPTTCTFSVCGESDRPILITRGEVARRCRREWEQFLEHMEEE